MINKTVLNKSNNSRQTTSRFKKKSYRPYKGPQKQSSQTTKQQTCFKCQKVGH